ncbi:hypothetical protein [Estrella lausannensis]|nr:hypothetical protein [Estrella lausannensis]
MRRKRSALAFFSLAWIILSSFLFVKMLPGASQRQEWEGVMDMRSQKGLKTHQKAVVKRSNGRKEIYLAQEDGTRRRLSEIRYGNSTLLFDAFHSKKSIKEKLEDVQLIDEVREGSLERNPSISILDAKSAVLDFDTGELQALDVTFRQLDIREDGTWENPTLVGKAKKARGNFLQAQAGFEAEDFEGTFRKARQEIP